jgi:catechol 2,3-dioxygenase
VVGHVHLETHVVGAARAFFVGGLGLAVTAERPGALFLARDGYHHHVAVNTWRGRTRPQPEGPDVLGLLGVELLVAGAGELPAIAGRLGVAEAAGGLAVSDPSGLPIRIRHAPAAQAVATPAVA